MEKEEMTKQVIVPQDKLDKLEEVRVKLYEFYIVCPQCNSRVLTGR